MGVPPEQRGQLFTRFFRAGTRRPDLILLDMRMPILDGWEFAEICRQQPGRVAPIVVLTAAQDAADIAAEIHAAGYVAKPFGLDDLLGAVEQHAQRETAA